MLKYVSEGRMRRYFSQRSTWRYATLFFVIGILSIIAIYLLQRSTIVYSYYTYDLLTHSFIYSCIGGFALSVIIIVVAYSVTPSDREFDQWLESRRSILANSVFHKLRIDPKQVISSPYAPQPLIIHGFVRPKSEEAKEIYDDRVYIKPGKDGLPRFSINTLLYFVPVEHHIAIFYCDINAIDQSLRYQETAHYYYHDVVGLTTDDQQIPIPLNGIYSNRKFSLLFQKFALEVSNGESIGTNVFVGIHVIHKQDLKKAPPFVVVDSEVDQIISALLMLLRSKKQSQTHPPQHP